MKMLVAGLMLGGFLVAASGAAAQVPASDEARLRALEEEVKALKEEVARLRAAVEELRRPAATVAQPPAGPPVAEIPTPQLAFVGKTDKVVRGEQFTEYRLTVTNRDDFPAELFASAPDSDAPASGRGGPSRTVVEIHDDAGKFVYGFLCFTSPANLDGIWFAVKVPEPGPEAVYIVLKDRKTGREYRSNTIKLPHVPPPAERR